MSFLRLWIRGLLASIDKFFDEIVNPMNCFSDLENPIKKGDLFENKPCRCNESQRECDIKDFFLQNRSEFDMILQYLKALPASEVDNETRQRISALKKIIKNVCALRQCTLVIKLRTSSCAGLAAMQFMRCLRRPMPLL